MVRRVLGKFLGLPRAERKLVLRAIPTLVHSVVSLKLLGFRRSFRRSTPVVPMNSTEMDKLQLHEAAQAIRRVSNVLGIGTCLSRSLALRKMLDKKGIRTELRIGFDKSDDEFRAHAWLEFNGTPIGDETIDGYDVFAGIK